MNQGYREDLAHIHDVGFGAFAEQAAVGLLAVFREHGINDGLIIDVGCGSGIWAKELVEQGYQVLGIDLSSNMIAIARGRAPGAEFRVQSSLSAELPPCQAITALGEVLNYQFDETNSRDNVIGFIHRAYEALQPGGLFVFDLAAPGRNQSPHQSFREGPDWACLVQYDHDDTRQQLTRSIVTYRKTGDLYRRDEETHRLQLYYSEEIMESLQETGFKAQTVDHYGEFQFPEAWVGYVCCKG
ncbi:MAG: class I SAM-dependent methyltransferase [Pirellulales bacterium]